MTDIFLQTDTTSLLDNRFLVIIGDSIQRAVYKDLVLLMQKNKYLTDKQLRNKGEFSFEGDKLIEGGQLGMMNNGVRYREVRQYQTGFHLARFYFVTRCYNSYMESILADLSKDPKPDVIIMNSCLWDISRYGASSVDEYKKNLEKLFVRFKEVLPESCLVIWNTTLPISKYARGGFLIPEVEFMNSTLRLDILEANFYAHKVAVSHGYNVLDLHYFLRHQLQRRAGDGVHWDMTAHRRMTNLLLTHIANAWDIKPPKHALELLKARPSMLVTNQNQPNQQPPRRPDSFKHNARNNLNIQMKVNMGDGINARSAHLMRSQYNDMPMDNRRGGSYHQNYNENDSQYENINRYGGPIRRVNYQAENHYSSPLMQIGNQQCVSNMHWEPYANKDYNPMLRNQGNQGNHNQGNPRRNNPYRTGGGGGGGGQQNYRHSGYNY